MVKFRLSLFLLILSCVYVNCMVDSTPNYGATQRPSDTVRKSTVPLHPAGRTDYDENYYTDISNVADIQNRTLNLTSSDDDEDSTNSDYLDELGSTIGDAFHNFNPDPYLDLHFATNKTTELPTTPEHRYERVDVETTEPMFDVFMSTVPNYSNETLPKCPDGFETHQTENSSTICFLEVPVSTYSQLCPYPNYIENSVLPYKLIAGRTAWTKPKRKIFDNFGTAFVTNTWSYNSSKTDCAIYKQPNIIDASCASQYPFMCAYSYEDKQYSFDNYCSKRFNKTCVAENLGFERKCYCLVRSRAINQDRNTFCKKLAEPLQPYQNLLLLKRIALNETCWIGFYQDTNDTLKWSSTNLPTNYTYWSFTTDFSKTYGAIGHRAWSLETENDLNCAICEVDITGHPSVQLRIRFNKITSKVRLAVENAIEIFGGIFCYSYDNEYHIDLTSNVHNHLVIDVFDVNDIPRYYWCKAYQIPSLTPVYSNRILARAQTSIGGRDYSVANKLEIPNSPYFMSQLIFNEHDEILHHIHTVPSNYTIQEEIDFLAKFISAEVKSSDACLPDATFSNNITLNWSQTTIGSTVLPDINCLQGNGYPVTRTCSGSFLKGATWSSVNGTCETTRAVNTTLLLRDLVSLSSHRKRVENQSVVEIYAAINLLKRSQNFTEFIQGVNNLKDYPADFLRESQYLLNATDILLESLKARLKHEMADNKLKSVVLNNIAIYNIALSHVSSLGFKLNSTQYIILDGDSDVLEDFDIILRIPQQLQDQVTNCSRRELSPMLALTLLKDDSFFKDVQNIHSVQGNIVTATIHPNECDLSTTIDLLYKAPAMTASDKELTCAAWCYGSNELMENIHGHWILESTATDYYSYKMCTMDTNAYLTILMEEESSTISNIENTVFTILGVFVTVISLLSLIAVLITSLVFKSHTYNHIAVINLSFSSAFQLILTFAVVQVKSEGAVCVTLAAVLHYMTLAQFIWMIVIAWFQHNRYISNKEPKDKVAVQIYFVAWGLPLLLVLILVSVSNLNYGRIAFNVCYAMGNNFTYSVLLLISTFLFIILIIFAKIMAKIRFSEQIKSLHLSKETSYSQLKVAVILYFLLGITWGLGVVTIVVERKAIPFIYSISACFQEIMIFLFFIVLNDRTRTLWVSAKNVCCIGKSKRYRLTPKRRGSRVKYSTSHF